MLRKKEITQAFSQDLLNCDYHIRFGFIYENYKSAMYEIKLLMQDDFVIRLDVDMFSFDEEQVIAELREMIEQVYGGDY